MEDVWIKDLDFESSRDLVVRASSLLLEEATHKYDDEPIQEGELEQYMDIGRHYNRRLYVALSDTGSIIAAAEVNHEADENRTTVWNLAVTESRRGSGIGSTLVKYIAAQAIKLNSEEIYALSLEDEFFKKLGFVEIETDEPMMASAKDVLRA